MGNRARTPTQLVETGLPYTSPLQIVPYSAACIVWAKSKATYSSRFRQAEGERKDAIGNVAVSWIGSPF